jgi:hypothetical protein
MEAYLVYYTLDSFSRRWFVSPISVSLSSQSYLSPDEEEEVRIAIDNGLLNDAKVTFRLVKGERLVQIRSENGDSTIYDGQMPSQTQISRNLKLVAMWDKGFLGKPIPAQLSLWGVANNEAATQERHVLKRIEELPISILTIPKARTIRNSFYVVFLGFAGWLIKRLWGRVSGE